MEREEESSDVRWKTVLQTAAGNVLSPTAVRRVYVKPWTPVSLTFVFVQLGICETGREGRAGKETVRRARPT